MRYAFLLLFWLFWPAAVHAQLTVPCESDTVFVKLRQGRSLEIPCDSMVLLTSRTFERIMVEKARQDSVLNVAKAELEVARRVAATQDSLVRVYRADIASLEAYHRSAQEIMEDLDAKVMESIENTQRAVDIAESRGRILGLLGSVLGAAAGLAIGAVVF